ncbi:hypothetical protein KKF84_12025 [Myxococcota bacterium]|nr:hypothetical protein [Myxococcota bacterium]
MSIPRFSLVARAMAGHFSTRYGSSAPLAGKLRKSAFVPNISMEYGRWDDMDISWSSRPGENLYQDEVVGTRQFFRVKLTWDARLLLFDPNDIILLREKRKETLLRESYDDRGRRMFFKWKRELLLFRRRPTLGRLLYLEELEAALDALSGAAFSRLCRGNVHGRFR